MVHGIAHPSSSLIGCYRLKVNHPSISGCLRLIDFNAVTARAMVVLSRTSTGPTGIGPMPVYSAIGLRPPTDLRRIELG